jgi:hypothetical protein
MYQKRWLYVKHCLSLLSDHTHTTYPSTQTLIANPFFAIVILSKFVNLSIPLYKFVWTWKWGKYLLDSEFFQKSVMKETYWSWQIRHVLNGQKPWCIVGVEQPVIFTDVYIPSWIKILTESLYRCLRVISNCECQAWPHRWWWLVSNLFPKQTGGEC